MRSTRRGRPFIVKGKGREKREDAEVATERERKGVRDESVEEQLKRRDEG